MATSTNTTPASASAESSFPEAIPHDCRQERRRGGGHRKHQPDAPAGHRGEETDERDARREPAHAAEADVFAGQSRGADDGSDRSEREQSDELNDDADRQRAGSAASQSAQEVRDADEQSPQQGEEDGHGGQAYSRLQPAEPQERPSYLVEDVLNPGG